MVIHKSCSLIGTVENLRTSQGTNGLITLSDEVQITLKASKEILGLQRSLGHPMILGYFQNVRFKPEVFEISKDYRVLHGFSRLRKIWTI